MVQLLEKVDKLQQELATLRGQLEEQSYQIKQMQQNTRDRYLDLDTRISALSKPGVNTASQAPSSGFDSGLATDSNAKASQAYREAFSLLGQKKFDKAIVALNKFLQDYPQRVSPS